MIVKFSSLRHKQCVFYVKIVQDTNSVMKVTNKCFSDTVNSIVFNFAPIFYSTELQGRNGTLLTCCILCILSTMLVTTAQEKV